MKNIYILIFALTVIWSCSDNFLEKLPQDKISSSDYWKSAKDLELYCNQFYGTFPVHGGWSGGTFHTDNNSDNLVPGNFNTRLAGQNNVPTSGGGWDWGTLRSINFMLANLSDVKGPEADVNHYIAEARFFRAWFYFEKIKAFGDVPWISKPLTTNSKELYNARNKRNVVFDSLLVDLDFAIKHLRNKKTFRLSRNVALAFKSRVCLFEGTWEKYQAGTPFGVTGSDGTRYLKLAAESANTLMENGGLSLYSTKHINDDYHNLFNKVDYRKVDEVIFWKEYSVDKGVTHNVTQYIPNNPKNTGVSKSLVDSYLCTDGKPISVSPLYSNTNLSNMSLLVNNRDPRFDQTVLSPGNLIIINSKNDTLKFLKPRIDASEEDKCTSGFQLFKGATTDYRQRESHNVGTIGAIIFRYAEVLLNFAEAKAELGTLDQGDIDRSIKLLRDRVGMPNLIIASIVSDPNKAFSGVSDLINEIRRERRVELACEGRRFSDLLRWRAHDLFVGKKLRGLKYTGNVIEGTYLDTVMVDDKIKEINDIIVNGKNIFIDAEGYISPYEKSLPSGYQFNPNRDYLKPLSTETLVLNDKLKQNPGW